MKPKLSILIPSLSSRKRLLEGMLQHINRQKEDKPVEVIVHVDRGQLPVGEKRNLLLDRASGDYVVFIDDDDLISDSYIEKVLEAIDSGVDVITFKLNYTTDESHLNWLPVDFSLNYKKDRNLNGSFERIPNHLCPMKSEIAKKTRFKKIKYGEDADFAKRVHPRLDTEFKINEVLYYYLDYKKK